MLLFYCGSSCFALDCEPVVEVFPKVKLKSIPGQKDFAPLVGLLNYGGKPVPVIDICQIIEKRSCSDAMHARLILVATPSHLLAILAEKVIETIHLEKEQFITSGLQFERLAFLGGVYTEGERSIQLFDLPVFTQSIQAILVAA